ncbi:MAG: hypothetical protein HRU15_00265 [Planctomycetes bacterium]|nr:hypothetical protein [Planctomycetota bacterium]
MNSSKTIKESLDIELPEEFIGFYDDFPFPNYSGKTEGVFWHNADQIIEWTERMRAGYAGSTPWPPHLLYIGADGAACPYALDTKTGLVHHLDHGDINAEHLDEDTPFLEWATFNMEEYELCEKESAGGCLGTSLVLIAAGTYSLMEIVELL